MVNFSDLSSGEIDTWNWNFGDETSSSTQHPMHEYLSPGNYTVSLSVEGIGGDDTMIKEDYILIPVGTFENPTEAIIVYPNPVSDKLHIVFPDTKSRKLLLKNMDGRNILTTKTSEKEAVIDIQSIPTGLYSLIIECLGTSSITVKVVKK
ncbi:MAG: PKD domain-containing protein [Bacteroidetes bacterium]|nr:PKD domain-containing protein [Bacteroidota bacterium]